MRAADEIAKRRTSADIVFESLYGEIISLGLLPGDKVSEVEVAEQFGVSRQPVRDAFSRLGSMELLHIQPQRATQIRKFSLSGIAAARLVRLAIELEVARTAAQSWTGNLANAFARNLARQEGAVTRLDRTGFHKLDEDFHRLVAKAADTPLAFDLILEKKAQVDRICVLSLKRSQDMAELVEDHRSILAHIVDGDLPKLEAAMRRHLSRIERTIEAIRTSHAEYFEA